MAKRQKEDSCTTYTIRPCKRGKAKWEVDFNLSSGRRLRRRSPVGSKADTKRWAQQEALRFDAERPKPAWATPSVREACDRWFETQMADVGNKARHLRWICRVWGDDTMLDALTPETIIALPARLSKPMGSVAKDRSQRRRPTGSGRRAKKGMGLAPGSIRSIVQVANSLLTFGRSMGWIEEFKIKLPKVPIKDAEWLRVEELQALLGVAGGSVWGVAWSLGSRAGLRLGEMVELRWKDVDLKARKLRIARAWKKVIDPAGRATYEVGPTKGRTARTIPITPDLYEALAAWRRKGASREVLVLETDAGRLDPQRARDKIREQYAAAGIDRADLCIHTLRHTFASHLAQGGAPAVQVQALCGHASLRTSERYMHLAPDQGDAGILHLPAIDNGNSPETSRAGKKKPPLRAV